MLNWKYSVAISLLGLASSGALADGTAYDASYDHKSSGPMVILPAFAGYDAVDIEAVWLHLAGREYRSGAGWWALRCKDSCELLPLSLTVTSKDHDRYDDTPMQGQVLQFSPRLAAEGVIAVFKPFRAPLDKLQLKAGPVTSWMPGREFKPKQGIHRDGGHVMGGELAVPGGEKLLFVPRQEQLTKAALQGGESPKVELELRMGGKRQWIGTFDFGISLGEGSTWEPSSYVRWVGDLDNDGKPDFIINTDFETGKLALYLSSLAGAGEIAGLAGTFTYFAPNLAGC